MTTFEIYELACRLYENSEKASGKLDFVPLHRRCATVITAWRNAAEMEASKCKWPKCKCELNLCE